MKNTFLYFCSCTILLRLFWWYWLRSYCFFYVNILKDKIQKFSKYRVFNKKAKGWSEFLSINSDDQQILVNDAIESICFILELDDKINKIQVDKEDKEDKKGGFCCCIRIESKLVS